MAQRGEGATSVAGAPVQQIMLSAGAMPSSSAPGAGATLASSSSPLPHSTPPSSSPSSDDGFCFLPRAGALSLSVAAFYAVTSLTLALVNKALLSAYTFNGYFLLLASQLGLSLLLCVATRDWMGNPFKIPQYDRAVHALAFKMGALYVVNVGAGLVALQLVNVPMFSCIRRLVSPVILIYEYLALGKVQSSGIQVAVALILTGTLVAGWDTLSADMVGYAVTMLNNVCTAAATVMQKQFSEATKASAFTVLYYNSLTALPISAAISVLTGEITSFADFEYRADPRFWGGFIMACSMGPLLTYSSMLSTTYNSPLATSITGNVKDVATTLLGAALFPGFVATVKSVLGLLASFAGAGLYSYINLKRLLGNGGGGAGAAGPAGGAGAGAGGAGALLSSSGAAGPDQALTASSSSQSGPEMGGVRFVEDGKDLRGGAGLTVVVGGGGGGPSGSVTSVSLSLLTGAGDRGVGVGPEEGSLSPGSSSVTVSSASAGGLSRRAAAAASSSMGGVGDAGGEGDGGLGGIVGGVGGGSDRIALLGAAGAGGGARSSASSVGSNGGGRHRGSAPH
jgi:hypothetical protein